MGRLAYAPYAHQEIPASEPAEVPRAYAQLRDRLAELHDLDRARAVLAWDERTMMPAGAAAARADQVTTLTRLRHERMTSPELGHLLDQIEPWAEASPTAPTRRASCGSRAATTKRRAASRAT